MAAQPGDEIHTLGMDGTVMLSTKRGAAEDLAPDSFNALKFVKFQQVFKLVIFIEDNGGADSTSLSGIEIFGKKVHTTKMSDLKGC